MSSLNFTIENSTIFLGIISLLIGLVSLLLSLVWRNFVLKVASAKTLVEILAEKLDKNTHKIFNNLENLKIKTVSHDIQIASLKENNLKIVKQLDQIQQSLLELLTRINH